MASPPGSNASLDEFIPPGPWTPALDYAIDAWQRSVLYADVMRQRGNQYQEHMAKKAPNVLSMRYEFVDDGRKLPRPVNYGLTRIIPPDDVQTDTRKRPFIIVDPRAGHGPGIGGFKPESEIGVAVRAGHPCYFIGFLPEPMPGQTVEDVMRAEAHFIEKVIALHPEAEGKPVVIGNCQAGWQIMMTAAMRPELFGPIILAGAPLSYWAGWRGMNPMRYFGGLVGGSWLTAFTSDLDGGKFDGAWLVQNFENLNPANTLWSKQYNLYSKVDTEAERYLGFEKWWGGHVFLNREEIQYIVDNLFIGNKLSSAELVTSDGIRLDLRNVKSPIIVFCSKGDNITPPPQALGWITDLYQDDNEVRAHGQTIVYAVHESIGHLGIFVSGSVARKEHQEFTGNIDMIDVLPPGIYEAEISEKTPDTPNADLAYGDYVLHFGRRRLDDVRKIVQQIPEDDRRFAAVKRIGKINLGLYRTFVQPWVRQAVTPPVAEFMQRAHPLRLSYEMFSDRSPLAAPLKPLAQEVRKHRKPVAKDNPFQVAEQIAANTIESNLEIWTKLRDDLLENVFMTVYGSPLVQDWAGLGANLGPVRKHPGISPEHREFMLRRAQELRGLMETGGLREACLRMLIYVSDALGGLDERSFKLIRKMRAEKDKVVALQEFKDVVRDQALMMMLDAPSAIAAMPVLLSRATPADIRTALEDMTQVVMAGIPLTDAAQQRLAVMREIFTRAADKAEGPRRRAPAKTAAKTVAKSPSKAARKTAAAPAGKTPRKRAPRKTAAAG
ncbi:DUF3141 domain-containing protein [Orrella sp. JC864]|uniref:DUF3141 domain-containing protein n=1 Tax=Orrella sp. JC864 TaxID=3120298 RepID=UPI00300BA98C